MNPLVSIIIPVYNRANIIGETLDSILNQTYYNWECIIIDDGSDDYIDELVGFYEALDSRVKFFKRPEIDPKGANSCRNYGFRKSSGKFIQWLDSDDLLGNDKIEKQIDALISENDLSVATCKWGIFSTSAKLSIKEDLKVYKDYQEVFKFFDDLVENEGYFPPHAYLIPRELCIRSGPWLDQLKVNQDGEYMVRVLTNCIQIKFSKTEVFYRSKTGDNISIYDSASKAESGIESWKIIESHLKLKLTRIPTKFISCSKTTLYGILARKQPDAIRNNKFFFFDQLPRRSRIKFLISLILNR
jgi:glycosyltransferase involved in cell wall biosynthesis